MKYPRSVVKCQSIISYNERLFQSTRCMDPASKFRTYGYIYKNFKEFISVRAPKVVGQKSMVDLFFRTVIEPMILAIREELAGHGGCHEKNMSDFDVEAVSKNEVLRPGIYYIDDKTHTLFRGPRCNPNHRIGPIGCPLEWEIEDTIIPFELLDAYAPATVFETSDEATDYLALKNSIESSGIICGSASQDIVTEVLNEHSIGIREFVDLDAFGIPITFPYDIPIGLDLLAESIEDVAPVKRHPEFSGAKSVAVAMPGTSIGYKMFHTPVCKFDDIMGALLTRESIYQNGTSERYEHISFLGITIYRMDEGMLKHLLAVREHNPSAAIVVYMELSARDSEESNLSMKAIMEKHGIKVITGHHGYKIHAKLAVVYFDNGDCKVHVGTGNYHTGAENGFVDTHVITNDPKIGTEAMDILESIFNHEPVVHSIVYSDAPALITSPMVMRDVIESCMMREIEEGEKGFISIKCNGIADDSICDLLDEAMLRDVNLMVNVRGMNTWYPGVNGHLGKNQILMSHCGKYLEHNRIYVFGDDAFIGSADLMTRNLDERVEVLIKMPKSMVPDIKRYLGSYIGAPMVNDWYGSSVPSADGASFVWEESTDSTKLGRWKYMPIPSSVSFYDFL